LIDAARPESLAARRFAALVDQLVTGQLKPGTELQLRNMLSKWKDNEQQLRPLAERSSFIQEAIPLSQSLSALGAAGLQALDYLDRGEKAPEAWKTQQLAVVTEAFQPKAQVLLMIAPAVQKLIQFSAGEKPTDLPLPKNALD